MLVLSRSKNESLVIGDGVTITVVEIRGDKVRLGIVAPKEMMVCRQEIWVELQQLSPRPMLDPAWLKWRDGAIVRLARTIVEKDEYESLPVLADALEEAGCADAGILDHCRSGSRVMVRSWVIELILSEAHGNAQARDTSECVIAKPVAIPAKEK